jgi:antibiotic biosynthesis monooxygenase (ABM) superfamily enzyme
VFSRRVKPGRQADFHAWAHGVTAAAHQFPSHLGAAVPDVSGSRDYHTLYTFADRASLEPALLQHIPASLPVLAGRLHHDLG